MGKGKIRTLLVACVMIMLCSAMIVGGTYALWTDTVTVSNHLVAGSLDVKLARTSLSKTYLDTETGYLTTDQDTTELDLSEATTANVFGIADDELIVPCSSYEATLKLSNVGSVAFNYDVVIQCTSVSNALAEQLAVYVDDVQVGYLSDFYAEGEEAIISQQTMSKTDAAKLFTVKIVFEDLDTNNNAKGQSASFDLVVKATQATQAPAQNA